MHPETLPRTTPPNPQSPVETHQQIARTELQSSYIMSAAKRGNGEVSALQ